MRGSSSCTVTCNRDKSVTVLTEGDGGDGGGDTGTALGNNENFLVWFVGFMLVCFFLLTINHYQREE